MILTVAEGGTLALTQQLSHLSDLGASPPSNGPHSLNPFSRLASSHNIFQVGLFFFFCWYSLLTCFVTLSVINQHFFIIFFLNLKTDFLFRTKLMVVMQ